MSQIIKPPVANVIQFLWAHLIHDIGCLAKSTAYNEDEAMQIIHLVLTAMINKQEPTVPGLLLELLLLVVHLLFLGGFMLSFLTFVYTSTRLVMNPLKSPGSHVFLISSCR